MANRFPLVIDSATQRIIEIPATDNLDLSGCNIANVGNINASYYNGNGSALTGITATTATTAVTVTASSQPNITSTGTLTGSNVNGTINLFSDTDAGIAITDYGLSGADNFDFGVAQARGTRASPSAVQIADNLFKLTSAGYTGNGTTTWDGSTGWKAYSPFYHYVSSLPAGANGYFGTGIKLVTSNSVANTASTTFTFDETGNLTIPTNVVSVGANISGTANIANVTMTKFNEKVIAGGSTGAATLTPDASAGTIYTYTVTGAITLSALANAVAGTSMTIILTQDATGGRLLTSTMKFAGASKTLSTAANAIDILSVFYDGTTYYASLTKGYA